VSRPARHGAPAEATTGLVFGGATPSASPGRLLVFFATVYAVQGLAEPEAGLATQPIFFLLKEEMGLSASETATFLALIGLGWSVKPLYGLLSDLVPFLGYRRRSYLLAMTAVAALGWLALGLLPAYPWSLTLAILGLTGVGLAFTDVLCDAVMVEEGQARGLTARFQSVQWTANYGASFVAGGVGGYLAAHVSYARTFSLIALFPALSLAASAWAVREAPARFDVATARRTVDALRQGLRSGPLRWAAGFLVLWNFSPSFGVPLEYHMVDELGITKVQLGVLESVGSGAAMLGALAFGRHARRLAPRGLLNVAIGLGVGGTLAYYGLVGWWSAVALTVSVSFVSAIALLATLDLAAQAVPVQAEGTFFALLMAVANLGTTGGEWLGGQLYDRIGLAWLIAVSAAATAACWLLVPWIQIPAPRSTDTSARAATVSTAPTSPR
jgi:predicted MFS family arabinose efflux permease